MDATEIPVEGSFGGMLDIESAKYAFKVVHEIKNLALGNETPQLIAEIAEDNIFLIKG